VDGLDELGIETKKMWQYSQQQEELGVFRDGRALHPWAKPAPNIMDWQVFGFPRETAPSMASPQITNGSSRGNGGPCSGQLQDCINLDHSSPTTTWQ
jgi:hypothetical protein